MVKDILVQNVDVDLLRSQRDYLVDVAEFSVELEEAESIGGLTNLLDAMLDIADGVTVNRN